MKINKKFAVENFNFFYKKLTEEIVEFEKIVADKVSFVLTAQHTSEKMKNFKTWQKEKDIYKKVCLLYCRLIKEYQFVAAAYEGKIPRKLSFKIENAYSVGEMIQRYQSIGQVIDDIDDMDDPYGEDEV